MKVESIIQHLVSKRFASSVSRRRPRQHMRAGASPRRQAQRPASPPSSNRHAIMSICRRPFYPRRQQVLCYASRVGPCYAIMLGACVQISHHPGRPPPLATPPVPHPHRSLGTPPRTRERKKKGASAVPARSLRVTLARVASLAKPGPGGVLLFFLFFPLLVVLLLPASARAGWLGSS